MRTDPLDVGTRLLVAGGGGGAGGAGIALEGSGELDLAGGGGGIGGLNPGGGTAGQPYGDPVIVNGGGGGGAATSSAAGGGGSSPVTGGQGHDGIGPVGGAGGFAPHYEAFNPAGGGGGGGCFGGGGGGAGLNQPPATITEASGGGGGGGGTSCVYASTIGAPTYNDGVSFDLGRASVTFDTPLQDQPITAQPKTIAATEGAGFTGTVATFTDPDTSASASEYSATIDWGDGSSTSSGTISGSGGEFSVEGAHTYSEEGSFSVTVKITDTDNPSNTATATSTANVADAALSSQCAAPATSPRTIGGATATFTDADPGGQSSDYTAAIDWGDNSSSTGTVSPGSGPGPYTVTGSHSYGSTGSFTVTTTIKDAGGSQTVATCKTLIFASVPGGGSFAIGDSNSAAGTHVVFWGAQWAKQNSLSGGGGPASFKGFAGNPSAPSCGAAWSAGPGGSSSPPAAPLPDYMAVIVTSSVSKSGSTITGDTPSMVVVRTDPGYAPDPGHPGTGTVVARIC